MDVMLALRSRQHSVAGVFHEDRVTWRVSCNVFFPTQVQDDSVSTAEPVSPLRSAGPHSFPPPVGEVAARKTPQPTVLWDCAVYQTLRGN